MCRIPVMHLPTARRHVEINDATILSCGRANHHCTTRPTVIFSRQKSQKVLATYW